MNPENRNHLHPAPPFGQQNPPFQNNLPPEGPQKILFNNMQQNGYGFAPVQNSAVPPVVMNNQLSQDFSAMRINQQPYWQPVRPSECNSDSRQSSKPGTPDSFGQSLHPGSRPPSQNKNHDSSVGKPLLTQPPIANLPQTYLPNQCVRYQEPYFDPNIRNSCNQFENIAPSRDQNAHQPMTGNHMALQNLNANMYAPQIQTPNNNVNSYIYQNQMLSDRNMFLSNSMQNQVPVPMNQNKALSTTVQNQPPGPPSHYMANQPSVQGQDGKLANRSQGSMPLQNQFSNRSQDLNPLQNQLNNRSQECFAQNQFQNKTSGNFPQDNLAHSQLASRGQENFTQNQFSNRGGAVQGQPPDKYPGNAQPETEFAPDPFSIQQRPGPQCPSQPEPYPRSRMSAYSNGTADPASGVGARNHYTSGYDQQGNSYQTSRGQSQARRLDPDQMPSPIQVIDDDRKSRGGPFSTAERGLVPPLITTDFTVVDEGYCSPRFMRSSIYSVPTTGDLLKQTSVPFALAISPFARLHEGEHPPPIVDPGEEGPVRCNRCRAYMSPFMQFIDAGRRFQCSLCKTTSEVPVQYFSHLDHMGQRVDKHERAELCLGSYEFIVNKDYCKESKFPNCPAFIFVIDVSYNSIRSGMVQTLCSNMKSLLNLLPREDGASESKTRVGFITYSTVIHFYNINSSLAQPQMLVVSDVQDMFMPLLDGFLVLPSEASHVINSLMEQIPTMFAETKETETVLGPAIQAGLEALRAAECAGKLFVFHSTLPIAEAPGKLKNRDDRKLLGTDKEKTILSPQIPFYNNLGQDCVKGGCCVDLFLFNNAYIDVATIGQVSRLTGGQLYKYTYFQSDLDGDRFLEDLRRDIERPIVFDAILRVRTSTGVRPTDFHGCFFMSSATDVELAALSCDSSLCAEIKYDDKLPDDDTVCIQCAVLYTSCTGQRRLRVHNLGLSTCNQMATLFRSCELDTIMNVFLKDGVRRVCEESPQQIQERMVGAGAQILACYRKNCAQSSSPGQLILPECMKLLPLYINCLLKCDAIAGAQETTTDDRSFMMLNALGMDLPSSAAYLYPRLIPLHDINPDSEYIEVPTAIRCSAVRLRENGIYFIENGLSAFLFVGLGADSEWIQSVFGVPSASRIDTEKSQLLSLNTPLCQSVLSLISLIQEQRQRYMRVRIVRPGDRLELVFRQLLVEDKTTDGSATYVDFLCHLHKEIRAVLS